MAILQRCAKSSIKQSESFKFRFKFLENTNITGIINGELAVPLKYLRNF